MLQFDSPLLFMLVLAAVIKLGLLVMLVVAWLRNSRDGA